MKSARRIKHRDWVVDASRTVATTVDLLAADRLPPSIEVRMIVVPVRRLLRGVYGSNLRAALALLWWAASGTVQDWWYVGLRPFWHLRVLGKTREEWWKEMEGDLHD